MARLKRKSWRIRNITKVLTWIYKECKLGQKNWKFWTRQTKLMRFLNLTTHLFSTIVPEACRFYFLISIKRTLQWLSIMCIWLTRPAFSTPAPPLKKSLRSTQLRWRVSSSLSWSKSLGILMATTYCGPLLDSVRTADGGFKTLACWTKQKWSWSTLITPWLTLPR